MAARSRSSCRPLPAITHPPAALCRENGTGKGRGKGGSNFSETLFCALDTLSPGRRHPFFSGGSHGDVSLKGVAVHSLSAIVWAPRKRPRDRPRAVAGGAGCRHCSRARAVDRTMLDPGDDNAPEGLGTFGGKRAGGARVGSRAATGRPQHLDFLRDCPDRQRNSRLPRIARCRKTATRALSSAIPGWNCPSLRGFVRIPRMAAGRARVPCRVRHPTGQNS